MTKPEHKATPQPKEASQPPDDLQVAYQCHTLAQIIHGQLAAAYPWLVQPPLQVGRQPWPQQPQWPGTLQ